jgi:hypothetical protein
MNRARNAVVVIALCLIAAYSWKKAPLPRFDAPYRRPIRYAEARDAYPRRKSPRLTLARVGEDDLRDAIADDAIADDAGGLPAISSSTNRPLDDAPAPRGSGAGGFAGLPYDPGHDFDPPPVLSPSGPADGSVE